MRHKIVYIFIAITGLMITSCEDFFDPQMKGNIEADVYYKNINNLGSGVNAIYNMMQSRTYQECEGIFGEAMSDNCWSAGETTSGGAWSDLLNFRFTTNNTYFQSRYNVNYQGINKCNQVIRSIPHIEYEKNGPLTNKNENYIRRLYAQAKVLRALFYFNLVKTFGGVSIQPENQDIKDLVVKRSTLDECYAYIEKDLREALIIFPEQVRNQTSGAGPIAIGGNLGLLMKVLLYEASPGIPLQTINKTKKWQEALEIGQYFVDGKDVTVDLLLKHNERYAGSETWEETAHRLFLPKTITPQTVMKGMNVKSIHGLYDFDKLFRVQGEYCVESLIEINHFAFPAGVSYNEDWPMDDFMNNNASTGATGDLFKTMYNGSNSTDPRAVLTLVKNKESVEYKYYIMDNGVNTGGPNGPSDQTIWWAKYPEGITFTKYYTWPSEGENTGHNYRIMRYAEVLLIYAEVLAETGDLKKAVDTANKVRLRAKKLLTDESNYTYKYQTLPAAQFKEIPYGPKDITLNNILKEKRIEMAGEYDRWFEIVRLGIVGDIFAGGKIFVNDNYGQTVKGASFRKGVNEIFPIPQNEVIISNGVIEQNFGY